MYGRTKIIGLIKCKGRERGLAAVAMAALIFLAALPPQTRAQGTNTYGGATVIHAGSIGLVPGQTVRVSVPNFQFSDGSVRYVRHTIRVTERESGLVYSGESGGLNEAAHEFGHVFTFRHEHVSVPGDAGASRVQVWIVVESFLSPTQERTEDRSADVLRPDFELIDDGTEKTILIGHLLPAIQKVTDKDGR